MNNPVSILPNDLREFVVQEESGWVEIRFPHAVSTPVVSVVVQTYQHGRFIEQTLQSILDQETSFQFEILVGEDGSDDGTREKCIEFAKRHADKIRLFLHDRSRVIKIGNRPTGRFNQLNNFAQAKGKFIAICEGDDYWTDSKKLEKQASFLERNLKTALVFTDCKTVNASGETISNSLLAGRTRNLSQIDLVQGRRVPTLTVMFRREQIKDLPREIEQVLNADTFIFAHLGTKGTGELIGEIEPAAYRIHDGGIWSSASIFSRADDLINTYRVITRTVDADYKSYAIAELRRKHVGKCVSCIRFGRLALFCSSALEYFADFGWTAAPRFVLAVAVQFASLVWARLGKIQNK